MKQHEFLTPPVDFVPVDICSWAEYSDTPPNFIRQVKHRGRRLLGVKYERKAQDAFRLRFGEAYLPSQWIRYSTVADPRTRWCQPDGVLVSREEKALTIIEFKYNHTEVAWWQLFRLYLPVLERLFDGHGYEFRCVEVCKWFDASVRCPQRPQLREDFDRIKPGEFAVHIWSP